ncbi:MAG: sulfur oxidation c-type cytochrome SoxA [Burkholderiaceae bacterium]
MNLRFCFYFVLSFFILCFSHALELHQRQSSHTIMSPQTKAMQDDPTLNPATFWIMDGESLWTQKPSPQLPACSECHGQVNSSMKGVSATFPKSVKSRLLNLDGQINQCRTTKQKQTVWPLESKALLSMSVLIANQSKGIPIIANQQPETQVALKAGEALFKQRMGHVNLSCAQCHDERYGMRLAGSTIPQAHPTGYPIYRLEWQTVGSLQRRLRNCMNAVRAQLFEPDAQEWLQLELYLMWRARGMLIESPGVRP